MPHALNLLLRGLCLLTFAAALARLAGISPGGLLDRAPYTAAALLAIHAGELLLFMPRVRRYRGPLWVSVALTMLYGLLHWMPLPDPAAQNEGHGDAR